MDLKRAQTNQGLMRWAGPDLSAEEKYKFK
jgi:hypothetical protein